jgi:GT2 family glycosyltransferase
LELFDRIGMFDEVYFTYGEEDDLVARAQAAGYRIVRLGNPIFHLGGGTTQKCNMKTRYLQMRNEIRFCLKNRGLLHALLRTARVIDVACNPWSLTFDQSNVAHCNLRYSGNRRVKLALWLRAVLWNIVRLPETLRIRADERRLVRAALISRKNLPAAPGPFQMAPTQGRAD